MPAITDFFVPKHRHFGLSIGRTSIRGVEVDARGRIKALAEIALPDTVFQGGILVEKNIFIEHLKKLIAAGKFSTKYVAVCFSEAHAYSREHAVPLIAHNEIHEAISWHVKDLFPFPEEDIYFDWKLIEATEKENKVLVVAIQKNFLDTLLDALISTGLKPLSCEPGAAAVSRLLIFKPGQHALVTEINRRGAYVTLVEGSKTLFTTVVNYTNTDTAESYLKNITQTILEVADYYKNKGIIKDESTAVVLTGEVVSNDWVQKMSTLVSYPVQILTTPVNNPAFNKAYAVAISTVAPPDDEKTINLLPSSIQQYYDRERRNVFYTSLLIRTAVILGIFCGISILALIAVSLQRQQLEARVKSLTAETTATSPDTQNLLLLNAQAKNIVDLAQLRATPKDKLVIIGSLLSDPIKVAQWDYDDRKLTYSIVGDAADRSDLLNFKNKLDASDEFAKVTLPLGSLETPKNVHFEISFITKK